MDSEFQNGFVECLPKLCIAKTITMVHSTILWKCKRPMFLRNGRSLDHHRIILGEDLVEIMAGIDFNHGDQKLMDVIDNGESHESIQKIINDGAGILARDIKGLPLIQLPATGGTAHAVETLLKNDPKVDDREGYTWKYTALMLAAEGGQDRHRMTVKILLSSNADTILKNTFKQTALDIARACKCPESEQYKHSCSADVLSLNEFV